MSAEIDALADVVRARLSWASLHWFPTRTKGGIKSPVIAAEIAPEIARAILGSDWLARRDAQIAQAVRRAVLDPGAFTKRGPDYDGEPYGERIDQWQNRAIAIAREVTR